MMSFVVNDLPGARRARVEDVHAAWTFIEHFLLLCVRPRGRRPAAAPAAAGGSAAGSVRGGCLWAAEARALAHRSSGAHPWPARRRLDRRVCRRPTSAPSCGGITSCGCCGGGGADASSSLLQTIGSPEHLLLL